MSSEWDKVSSPVVAKKGDEWDAVSTAAPRQRQAAPDVPPVRLDPSEGMSPLDKLLVGAGYATDRAMRGMSGAIRAGAEAMGAKFDPNDDKAAREAEDAELYRKYHPGGWATAGEIGADVAMSAMPVAKGGRLLTKALSAAKVPMAAAAGDVAANAAYGALTSPEDRGTAAMFGGGGAAAGRLLAKTLAARMPKVAPGVKELSERGVSLTPGQIYGPGALRTMEDRLTSTPVIGDLLARARKRSLESYNAAELADALAPLGRQTHGVGADAVDTAMRHVESAYDEALERVFMTPKGALDAARGAVAEAQQSIPLLDPRQLGQLDLYVRKRIEPWVEALGGADAPGKYVKQIDAEIGHYARKYSKSVNPSDHALGDAFYMLQSNWRDAMQASGRTSSGRNALELLQGANEAYKNLLPIRIASERTTSGVFTPQGVRAASKASKLGSSELTEAARKVLPSTVPDSGTAGRVMLPIGLGSLATGIDPLGMGSAALATGVMTSGPAMRGMTATATKLSGKGIYDLLPDFIKRELDAMPPGEAERALANLTARFIEQQARSR